jgi:hypothetical protein
MAVCNLFSNLDKISGNFMLFSQYVEDLTRNFTEGENFKVVPSRFVALNIDYSNIDIPSSGDLNVDLPKYLQNYFENACAYGRNNLTYWDSIKSRNIFWTSLFDSKFLTKTSTVIGPTKDDVASQVKYWGDINTQSYNEHNGMGYNELYCYIPSDAGRYICKVKSFEENRYPIENPNNYLEGYDASVGDLAGYSKTYYYDVIYQMSFDDNDIASKELSESSSENYYDINTIVVLYDVMKRDANNNWSVYNNYKYIPMGMYVCGKFDEGNITNPVRKYVNTSYDLGTSYGLRICTRFTVAPNGSISGESEMTIDSDNNVALNQLMTAMGENLDKMLYVSSSSANSLDYCKDTLSIIKNNTTNVPYVKTINGIDYWFVNGKMVSQVSQSCDCENDTGTSNPGSCDCDFEYAEISDLEALFQQHDIEITV